VQTARIVACWSSSLWRAAPAGTGLCRWRDGTMFGPKWTIDGRGHQVRWPPLAHIVASRLRPSVSLHYLRSCIFQRRPTVDHRSCPQKLKRGSGFALHSRNRVGIKAAAIADSSFKRKSLPCLPYLDKCLNKFAPSSFQRDIFNTIQFPIYRLYIR
jgi:hypothetical protein